MKRRTFFGLIAAGVVAAVLPKPEPKPQKLDRFDEVLTYNGKPIVWDHQVRRNSIIMMPNWNDYD